VIRTAAFAALLLGACASAPAPGPGPEANADPEREAILATVDAFLLSVGNGDKAAREALEMRDGFTYFSTVVVGAPASSSAPTPR